MSEENRYQHNKKFLQFNDVIGYQKTSKLKQNILCFQILYPDLVSYIFKKYVGIKI